MLPASLTTRRNRAFVPGRHLGLDVHWIDARDGPLPFEGRRYIFRTRRRIEQLCFRSDPGVVGSSQMVNGGDAGTIYYDDFATGTGVFRRDQYLSGQGQCQSYTQPAGYFFSFAAR